MENTVRSMSDLAIKISELEAIETAQTLALKQQGQVVMDGLKPSALLKSAFGGIISSKNLQAGAIDTTLGVGVGWLAKKLYVANSHNIFKKITGFLLQNLTTGVVAAKMPAIRKKISGMQDK